MKKRIFFVFFVIAQFLVAQTKITVRDGFMEDQLMDGVIVVDESNNELGKTNANGVFVAPAGVNRVSLIYDGYEEKKLFLYGKPIVVKLEPISVELETSEISGDDERARNLIKKVIENRKKNSTENLKTYEYKSYSKFLVTASTDSLPYILLPKNESDSSYNDMRRLLDKSHLMLGERAMDHKFSDQFGTKNIVKASRISGTRLPMYEFAAMQPISTRFDEERFKFFFRSYINPASNPGLREYRFRISDYEDIDGKPMIVVAFYPVNTINKEQKIKGYLWIEKDTYAITRFYAENISDARVAELEMDWVNFKGYWFPEQQRLRMDGGEISYPSVRDSVLADGSTKLDTIQKKEKVWLHLATSFKDIQSPVVFDKKEFRGYADEFDIKTMADPDKTLEEYRIDSLTQKEQNTYVQIDSIGQKYKVDKNLKLLRIITTGGKYSIGKYDLDLTKIINYNRFEGFRLGVGGSTNHKFSEAFSLNGYAAYGTHDGGFKYGGGIDFFVNKPYSGKIFAQYANDVEPSGRNPIALENNYLKYLTDNFVNIYNDIYFSLQKVAVGYQQDLMQNVTMRISGIYNQKAAQFEYNYRDSFQGEVFGFFDTELALRWAPKDRIARTPYGKVTINSGLPVFYLMASQGWNIFNADYQPTKINFVYRDRFRTFLGRTNLQIRTGAVFGDTPIFNLFEGMGNARNDDRTFRYVELAGLNNFETMKPSEFYSDLYFMFHISQRFGGFKLFKREIFPAFIYRGLIGSMRNRNDHKDFTFDVPTRFYQETGIEFNQLFFGALGIGAYYRVGSYAFNNFEQNFLVKLNLRISLF